MEIKHTVFKIFLVSLYFIVFAMDKVNEENWQNMLINIKFCQYFINEPSYYFDLTEFWSENLPVCSYGLKH